MTFYEDLSPYVYFAEESVQTAEGYRSFTYPHTLLNVGWLDREQRFRYTRARTHFTSIITEVVAKQSRINLTRGAQTCDFCDPGRRTAEPFTLGNGEIRVPQNRWRIFAAPVLIGHYVTAHGYLPPQEFVEATTAFVDSGRHVGDPYWIPQKAARLSF